MDLISEDLTKRTHLQHLFIKLFLKNIVLVVIDASAGSEETIFFFQTHPLNRMLQDYNQNHQLSWWFVHRL